MVYNTVNQHVQTFDELVSRIVKRARGSRSLPPPLHAPSCCRSKPCYEVNSNTQLDTTFEQAIGHSCVSSAAIGSAASLCPLDAVLEFQAAPNRKPHLQECRVDMAQGLQLVRTANQCRDCAQSSRGALSRR